MSKTVFTDTAETNNKKDYTTPYTLNHDNSTNLYYNTHGYLILREDGYIIRDNTHTLYLLITSEFTGKFKITVTNTIFSSREETGEKPETRTRTYYSYDYGNMQLVEIPLSDFPEKTILQIRARASIIYGGYLIDRNTGSLEYETDTTIINTAEQLESAVLNCEPGSTLTLMPGTLFELDDSLVVDKMITLRSGNVPSTITCKTNRAILITSTGNLTLNNIIIQDCYVTNTNVKGGYGAGIYIDSEYDFSIYRQGRLTMTDCKFVNNHATMQGGAIFNHDGIVTGKNIVFYNNTAKSTTNVNGDGGAIYNNKIE